MSGLLLNLLASSLTLVANTVIYNETLSTKDVPPNTQDEVYYHEAYKHSREVPLFDPEEHDDTYDWPTRKEDPFIELFIEDFGP